MGVTGLWRLIEPAGKPVPIETLENKVLAVDISIWLHQVVKGYQDARGAPMPNAHLMGLFQRLCKLLYFRIKPVFVFDGGFPELKRETIAKRHDSKTKYNSESERLKRELALLLTKKTAIGSILGNQISPKKPAQTLHPSADDDIFKLPELPQREVDTESESEDEDTSSGSIIDVHSVDVESETFKTMPLKEKYDLLIELKETRKMNSWGRIHELPKKSDNFSDFQMQRLLKRRKIQECLERTEKEMGVTSLSLNELESLLNAEGIDTKLESLPTSHIASSDTLRYLLIKDLKQTRAEIENKEKLENEAGCSKDGGNTQKQAKIDELEEDLRKAIKMSLEEASTDTDPNTVSNSQTSDSLDSSYMFDSDLTDSGEDMTLPDMTSAKAYIKQYSDFTYKTIDDIVSCTKHKIKKPKPKTVDVILNELNAEKSLIADKVELSSSNNDECDEMQSADEQTNTDTESCVATKTKFGVTEQNNVVLIDDSDELNSDKSLITDKAGLSFNDNDEHIEMQSADEQSMSETESSVTKSKSIDLKKSNSIVLIDSNTSQSSMDLIENKSEIINLDSSIDERNIKTNSEFKNEYITKLESDSSDGEFEEVIDENNELVKPVVQFNLNVGTAPEDDIFADIFTKTPEKNIEKEVIDEKSPQVGEKHLKIVPEEVKNVEANKDGEEIVEILQEENKDIDSTNIKATVKVGEEPLKENSTVNIESEKETIDKPKLTRDDLNTMVVDLEKQEAEMIREKSRLDRIGRNVTDEMTKDVQELLEVFGIPYVIAPMEAEAQCAFLESIKLTDGTITDDSDIWLFGGRTVYKNFFNQKKHVLQFISDTIENSYNLSREQLVLLALLVGSDYTTGVMGVGPVTAMEILASFPYNKKELAEDLPRQMRYTKLVTGLQEFKKWIKGGKRTDNTILKKKLRNICVADDFPSTRVVQAYFEPNVDTIKNSFTWGELNITVLRDYTKAKFGWSQNKLDEIIQPVMRRLLERKKQSFLHDYFKRKGSQSLGLEEHMSKRVKAAVHKMGPELEMGDNKDISKVKPKRKRKNVSKKGKQIIDEAVVTNTEQEEKKARLITKKVKQPEVIDSKIEIKVPKLNRYQEIIPQREKNREHLLQNRMKAIEVFRKTNIDKKRVKTKRKAILPKEDAGLSESDSD